MTMTVDVERMTDYADRLRAGQAIGPVRQEDLRPLAMAALHLAGLPGPRRAKAFNYPPRGEVRDHRTGTKRARLIDLLSRPEGGTVEEAMEACGWGYRGAQGNIRALWDELGYGLAEDEGGRIRLVRPGT